MELTITINFYYIFAGLGAIGGIALVYFILYPTFQAKRELVKLVDKSPVQNQSMKNLARNLGAKYAYEAIKDLK